MVAGSSPRDSKLILLTYSRRSEAKAAGGVSLHLPSARRQAARDGAKQAGSPSDGRSNRRAVCARHEGRLGAGRDETVPRGETALRPVKSPALPTQVRILSLPHNPVNAGNAAAASPVAPARRSGFPPLDRAAAVQRRRLALLSWPPARLNRLLAVSPTVLGRSRYGSAQDVLCRAPPLWPPLGPVTVDRGAVRLARTRVLHGWARGRGLRHLGRAARRRAPGGAYRRGRVGGRCPLHARRATRGTRRICGSTRSIGGRSGSTGGAPSACSTDGEAAR